MSLNWELELGNNREYALASGHDRNGLAVSILKFKDGKFHAFTYGPRQSAGVFDSMIEGMKAFGFTTEVK